MTDNPYINKQNWGRDLLDRLNNLSDDDGSFNIWNELPTTGKDGALLNASHSGYVGILIGEQSAIYRWDGSEWNAILTVPLSLEGIPGEKSTINLSGGKAPEIFLPFPESSYYILFQDNEDSTGTLQKYLIDNTLSWSSTVSYEAGYTTASIGMKSVLLSSTLNRTSANQRKAHFLDVDATGNIYFALTISSATGSKFYVYSYTSLGVFRWSQLVDTRDPVTGGNRRYQGGICCANNSLFVTIGVLNRVVEINTTSGVITNNVTLGFAETNIRSEIYKDEVNDNLIFWLQNADIGSASIGSLAVVPYTLAGVVRQKSIIAEIPDHVPGMVFQHPVNTHLFYLWDNTGNLWEYNSLTNALNQKASLENTNDFTKDHWLLYVSQIETNILEIGTSLQGEILVFRIDLVAESIKVARYKFPKGDGICIMPMNESRFFSSNSLDVMKVSQEELGYKGTFSSATTISTSKDDNQVIFLSDAVFSTKKETNLFQSELNANAAYFSSANIDLLSSDQIIINNAKGWSSINPENAKRNSSPLVIGDRLSLFSVSDNSGGLSAESIGYTGTSAGNQASGILFSSAYCAGRFVSTLGSGSLYSSAILLHDSIVNKTFLQVRTGVDTGSVLPNFPDGSGLTITQANNFGFGTQSPAYKVDIVGTMQATTVRNSGGVITSDPQLKLNMTSLPGLELWDVCQLLHPISFAYKSDFEVEIKETGKDKDGNDTISVIVQKWPLPQGIQYGYNALEIAELFPELVDANPQGIKYLNSGALFPIFQSAATAKIQSLESEVETLKQLVQSLVARIEVLENA